MVRSRNGSDGESGSSEARRHARPDEHRFDRWLRRALHRLYDPVLDEPAPEELVRSLDGHSAERTAAGPQEGGRSG